METAHDFRLRYKSYITRLNTGNSSKEIKDSACLLPTHATIFVARSYPAWQTFVINELKALYLAHNRSVPDNRFLSNHFKDRPEINKKYLKKFMPFLIYCKEVLEKTGDIASLDQHLSFDEYQALKYNEDYLRRTLNVEQLDIQLLDNDGLDAAIIENVENILPGKPLVLFRQEPLTMIRLINRQPYSANFEWSIPLIDGDTIEKLEQRLRRHADRQLRMSKVIRLFHFKNWPLDSRKIPNIATPFEDLVEFKNKQQVLKINQPQETLVLDQQDIGNTLVYFVE